MRFLFTGATLLGSIMGESFVLTKPLQHVRSARPSAYNGRASAGAGRALHVLAHIMLSAPVAESFEHAERALAHCLSVDRPRFAATLARLRASRDDPSQIEARLASLRAAMAESEARVRERLARMPRPTFPESLPVAAKRQEIAAAIAAHPVAIVCGETGSGKTTQLPKICLELGRGGAGLIGHTQPRRIAARSVAARIAEELGSPLGALVGYKVRFQDKIAPSAYVKLMTDGILLAETQGDRLLAQYDTIIVDEA